jgi:archaellum component FlaC
MEGLEQGGLTAALVALVLALTKFVQSQMSKRNGGDVCTKIALLQSQVDELKSDVADVKRSTEQISSSFVEFREEMRLNWQRVEVREQVLREVKNESTG